MDPVPGFFTGSAWVKSCWNEWAIWNYWFCPTSLIPNCSIPATFLISQLDSESILPLTRLGYGDRIRHWCGGGCFLGSQVVAVDIDPDATRCARINALVHKLEDRIDVRQGDLFAPVEGERFDTVLFNPPYFRGEPKDQLDRAFRSQLVATRFSEGLTEHLNPGGSALVVLSSNGEIATFLDEFALRAWRLS